VKRVFRSEMEGVALHWRELHNEELHNLYASTDIVRVIESRRMRWVGNVALQGT